MKCILFRFLARYFFKDLIYSFFNHVCLNHELVEKQTKSLGVVQNEIYKNVLVSSSQSTEEGIIIVLKMNKKH